MDSCVAHLPKKTIAFISVLRKDQNKMNCEKEGAEKKMLISIYSEEKMLSICKLLKSILFKGFILTEDLVPGT